MPYKEPLWRQKGSSLAHPPLKAIDLVRCLIRNIICVELKAHFQSTVQEWLFPSLRPILSKMRNKWSWEIKSGWWGLGEMSPLKWTASGEDPQTFRDWWVPNKEKSSHTGSDKNFPWWISRAHSSYEVVSENVIYFWQFWLEPHEPRWVLRYIEKNTHGKNIMVQTLNQ